MTIAATALDPVPASPAATAGSDIPAALALLQHGNVPNALAIFGAAFSSHIGLPPDQVAGVMIEVAGALIAAFEADGQSPAAYDFLRMVGSEAAEVIAGLLQLANFPAGDEDPSALSEPVMLACAGALSAAGRHDDALSLLGRLLVHAPNRLALSHAMFAAQQRQAGLSDDLRGRFCEVPFEGFDVLPQGHVHLCCAAFMPRSVGNLFVEEPIAIWNGRDARAIRQSIHDGSFRSCDKLKCPRFSHGLPRASDLAAGRSDQGTRESALESVVGSPVDNDQLPRILADRLIELPTSPSRINLSFDRTCNLACPSCRTDFIAAKSSERDAMLAMTDARIMPLLETARAVTVTGSGDPFASKTFRHILRSLQPERCPDLQVHLITNGVLFTPAEWEKIAHLHGRIAKVNVSIDAACADTYAIVRRGGDWERLLANLRFLADLARDGAFASVNLAFVVQAQNWREIPAFVALGRELGAGYVYFSVIENWGTFDDVQFAANAVHLPSHPEHEAFMRLLETAPELDEPHVLLGASLLTMRKAHTRLAHDTA